MTNPTLSPKDVAELRELLVKATPQDINSAERTDESLMLCPTCEGDGEVTCETYTNYDGHPQGVQFFGVGNAHLEAAALFRRLIQHAPALLDLASQSLEREGEIKRAAIEECARVADQWLFNFEHLKPTVIDAQCWVSDAVRDIADVIRSLERRITRET